MTISYITTTLVGEMIDIMKRYWEKTVDYVAGDFHPPPSREFLTVIFLAYFILLPLLFLLSFLME